MAIMKAQEIMQGVVDVMGAQGQAFGHITGAIKKQKGAQTELKAPFREWRISRRKWPTV